MVDVELSLRMHSDGKITVNRTTATSPITYTTWQSIPVTGGHVHIPVADRGNLTIADVDEKIAQIVRVINNWDKIELATRLALESMGEDDEAILGKAKI